MQIISFYSRSHRELCVGNIWPRSAERAVLFWNKMLTYTILHFNITKIKVSCLAHRRHLAQPPLFLESSELISWMSIVKRNEPSTTRQKQQSTQKGHKSPITCYFTCNTEDTPIDWEHFSAQFALKSDKHIAFGWWEINPIMLLNMSFKVHHTQKQTSTCRFWHFDHDCDPERATNCRKGAGCKASDAWRKKVAWIVWTKGVQFGSIAQIVRRGMSNEMCLIVKCNS